MYFPENVDNSEDLETKNLITRRKVRYRGIAERSFDFLMMLAYSVHRKFINLLSLTEQNDRFWISF